MFSNYDVIFHKNTNKFEEESRTVMSRLTGFSSSDGAVIVSRKRSAVFIDSRYELAAHNALDKSKFEIANFTKKTIVNWIKQNITNGCRIAYDANLLTISELEYLTKELNEYLLVPINILSELCIDSPNRNCNIIPIPHVNNTEKFRSIYQVISDNILDAYIITDECTISWLLNIRDISKRHTPSINGYLMITKNKEIILFSDCIQKLDQPITIKRTNEIFNENLQTIGIDIKEASAIFYNYKNIRHVPNPCHELKVIKTTDEICNTKKASTLDSLAITRTLHWLHTNKHKISEMDVVQKVEYFRKASSDYIGNSFETISAADDNGAIVHYSPNKKNNKLINNLLLLDSGGQYLYGTTDITRTVSLNTPSDKQRLFFTLVLKGHIAVANAKFPVGTSGAQLDTLARQFLWQYNGDYGHSTGHGIGYLLHVHEGPIGISKKNNFPLKPGMILSNEPGYYVANEFGIRLENMLLVRKHVDNFLCFETISLVPFDKKFIISDMLSHNEIEWYRNYHETILNNLDLSEELRNWIIEYSSL